MNRRAVFHLVLGNPRLRRAIVAFTAFNLADWARWLAVLIYAFDRGGAVEAGAASLLQLLPAAVVAPLAASLGDRYRRDHVVLGSYVAQATLMLLTGLAVAWAAPAALVYGLAILGACAITLTRPAHGALLPWLARSPAELTAANAASGTVEGLGILVGQALAGIVIQFGGPGPALLMAAGVAGLGAASVAGLAIGVPRSVVRVAADASERGRGTRDLLGGFRALVSLHGPRTIVLLLGVSYLVWGALDVLLLVLVLQVAGSGESGVGFLNALTGVGALIGATFAFTFVGRVRLAAPLAAGLIVWGLPLAAIGLLPVPAVAGILLMGAGAGRSVLDVVGRTLLQRSTPDAVLSRVLGLLEGMFMAAFGIGAIATPLAIALVGPQGAFILVGLLLPLAALAGWRSLRAIDRTAAVPVRELTLLRGDPLFSPLSPPILERLASYLEPVSVGAGQVVIRETDPGDHFYLVDRGELAVAIDGRAVRSLEPGSSFGEIALLRDIPRTATVTARTDCELLALDRGTFLAAVTGQPAARAAADRLVGDRLGEAGAG